jgi:adenine-specific DNA-methyltransferase
MPTLNWIGKEAVVKHHSTVPFRLLEPVPELSCGDSDSGNLIVQGDNLHALKALLPLYAGQVKCIYIDPPYNTGNEGWVYNDNVNSPEIRRWLGEVVGKEGETLDRHDRWLSMMYPRLVLLKQFLRDDGAIFVSIDDNEVATLRLLMDEVFGASNFRASITWQRKYSVSNNFRGIATITDYILAYSRTEKFQNNLLPRTQDSIDRYSNPDGDPRGPWKAVDYLNQVSPDKRPNLCYDITNPNTGLVIGNLKKAWKYELEVHREHLAQDRIWWGISGTNTVPALKLFLGEVRDGMTPHNWWPHEDAGHTDEAKKELDGILGPNLFDTPKPTRLIQRILQIVTDKDSIILDSFAGSGTTGHAVLKQNAEDGGTRRFILVEMDENIARNVTAERVKGVSTGYTNAKGNAVEGLGGGFQFCRLSAEPLFTAEGQIRSDVTFAQLAEFVWFAETGTGWNPSPATVDPVGRLSPSGRNPTDDPGSTAVGLRCANPTYTLSPLLGVHEERAIFLLYNGILKDKSSAGGNVLTGPVFDMLPKFAGPKVIYAAANRMGGRAAREGITFKQTPYALEV